MGMLRAIGSMLLIGACGSQGAGGGDENGGEADPANVVRADFDQGYLSGRLGSVTVDGEASSVQIEEFNDYGDAYTSIVVRVDRADGSWGMTILSVEGTLAQVASGEATVNVIGCSGPEADVMDWDVPADDVQTSGEPDPTDANSTIVSIDVTFSDGSGEPERETWWGGSDSSVAGDVVTTLLRVPR